MIRISQEKEASIHDMFYQCTRLSALCTSVHCIVFQVGC
jgi:hypothetical protein